MDAITTLLSQFSVEGIILIVVLFLVAVKFVGELFEYCYTKIKRYFDIKDEKEERHEEIMGKLEELEVTIKKQEALAQQRGEQIASLTQQIKDQESKSQVFQKTMDTQIVKFSDFQSQLQNLCDRMQDSTRAYIIDKHHHYCYQIGAIDDMALQDLERRFMYYKAAGGNTFIDSMMEEVRNLPRLTLEQMQENRKKGGC